MIQQQTSEPDFIPYGGGSASAASPDFIPYQASNAAPPAESQSSSVLRFLKAAGSRLYAGTAGAGPQQSGTITNDFSAQQAQAKAGTLPSAWQTLKNSASDASPSNIDIGKTLSSINPIGDLTTAEGLGSTAANLLMLKKAFQQARTGNVAEFNAPNTSEMVQPIRSYSKTGPQKLLPAAPIELGPSSITPQAQEGLLPAARKVFDDGRVQYLTRPLRSGESPDVYKNTNTNVQEYFIQKMRAAMERPTVSGDAEQQAVLQRMMDYAKTPVDKAGSQVAEQGGHAGGAVTSAEELNRPGTNYVVSKSGQLTYHGKAFSPEATPSGASHVTVLQDGTIRVNAGPSLTEAQELTLRNAQPNPSTPRPAMSDADRMDLLMKSIQRVQSKAKSAKAGD